MTAAVDPSAVPTTSAVPLMQSLNETISATTGDSPVSTSARGLLSLPFRALHEVENLAFVTVPHQIVRLTGLGQLGLNFWSGPAATTGETTVAADAVVAASQAAANMAGEGAAQAVAEGDSWYLTEFLRTMHKVGGFFGYLTSVWSFACLVEALILNRITIYASTRRHLRLGWERRLALRIIPILLFASQILSLLRGIRCQSSPSYSSMRYGTPEKHLVFDYASGGGALHWLSSSLLPWESDEQACSVVQMARSTVTTGVPYGSFSLLWPVFLLLCLSHFVETLSCALQGRPVMTETGMSIFEHSLAFAEAESMIAKSIGLGLFGLPKQSPLNEGASSESSNSPLQLLTRAQVLERMNVTPELLLIVLISCLNSLSSHILDVLGKQSRYRLFNTAVWGFCFMAAMSWGLENGPPVSAETGVLKFPTVCIVGFIPHLLVLLGILICLLIYGLALFITALSMSFEGDQPTTLRQRFTLAHENMQGSNQIRSIRVNRHEDFYTTLLRIGYVALTAASEAVFLNEGQAVIARQMTWLEKDRLAEIEASRERNSPHGNHLNQPHGGSLDPHALSSFEMLAQPAAWESGYTREKKIEKPKNGSRVVRPEAELGGVGAVRADGPGHAKIAKTAEETPRPSRWTFWILTEDGELELPGDYEFDVELEMKKCERSNKQQWEGSDERRLDAKLYDWWKAGGSWGNQDHTPDYTPVVDDDDDTTSVVSMSTNASESEWEDYPSDGRRTPTQSNPYPGHSRESSPLPDPLMDMSSFARLLDPRDRESREEARILAAHLSPGHHSSRIMTRSQYQRQVETQRSQVLLSSRLHRPPGTAHSEKRRPTAEEEMELLEQLILSRRAETASTSDPETWESGATGLGPNGPPCVVCQTSPRSIITWPCRCLCICEDCRVSLAMNNFGSCVTCRQEVGGFMRLWVP
ncbi:hypothetical protein N7512_001952 [Penicillium capsulatum]|nr:hypothetical protein N7512_001952 [Penicillium capsulatum]